MAISIAEKRVDDFAFYSTSGISMILRWCAVFVLLCVVCGCARIVSRNVYSIPLVSNVPATVEVRNCGKLVETVQAPTTLQLKADAGSFIAASYSFRFMKEGYPDTVKIRNAYLDGWYWGNFLFGGLIGFLIVDPDSGSMWCIDENPIGVDYQPIKANEMEKKDE